MNDGRGQRACTINGHGIEASNEVIAGKALLRKANLWDDVEKSGQPWKTLADLDKVLDRLAQAIQQKYQEQTALANAKAETNEKTAALQEAQRLQETPDPRKSGSVTKNLTHIYSISYEEIYGVDLP